MLVLSIYLYVSKIRRPDPSSISDIKRGVTNPNMVFSEESALTSMNVSELVKKMKKEENMVFTGMFPDHLEDVD